ncbi:Abi family protein [Alcanivorax sp. S71-1-4]|uniref:Abi family protein n=1 Tax=Alcanivorax sp. S71-1-4 TaxID=1177159 RepID=UPI001357DF84|nr:Abi family protein [Alcanivorax sp. S71-1-4]KAF0807828.1 Abi family protein [Alcanivorax sp. S71-1-4]
MTPPRQKVPYPKPATTFSGQVRKMRSRGLVVTDIEEAEFYLAQINYYRLAAYCLPFEQDHASHTFTPGTSFSDVLNLYVFDREFRLLLLDAIERIEVSVRTQMAYHLSHNHGTAHPHLKPDLFHDPLAYGHSISRLASEVRSSKEEFIRHLTTKYQELLPPIWAVVELMTMGQLSKWFSNIRRRKDRQAISQIYHLDEQVMTSFCEHLALVRNHAAHHSRLWNRDFTKTMKLPRSAPPSLLASLAMLPDTDRRLRKLYNTLTTITYLMDTIAPGNNWKMRLKHMLATHNIDTSRMGFPTDWSTRPVWV